MIWRKEDLHGDALEVDGLRHIAVTTAAEASALDLLKLRAISLADSVVVKDH